MVATISSIINLFNTCTKYGITNRFINWMWCDCGKLTLGARTKT